VCKTADNCGKVDEAGDPLITIYMQGEQWTTV